jgi:hypothetical protein
MDQEQDKKNKITLMKSYEKGGLGPTKFASRQAISLNQLKYWIKILKKQKASKSPFIQPLPSPHSKVSPFVEIYYPNGVRIQLNTSDLPFLSQLVTIY